MGTFIRNHSLIAFYKPDGKILFQDRTSMSKNGEHYGFFGGGVDGEETFLEACLRETFEELNIKLQKGDVTNAVNFTKTISTIGTSENHVFISPWKEQYNEIVQILEGDAGVWMTLEEAKIEVFFNHDYMIFHLLELYFSENKTLG